MNKTKHKSHHQRSSDAVPEVTKRIEHKHTARYWLTSPTAFLRERLAGESRHAPTPASPDAHATPVDEVTGSDPRPAPPQKLVRRSPRLATVFLYLAILAGTLAGAAVLASQQAHGALRAVADVLMMIAGMLTAAGLSA